MIKVCTECLRLVPLASEFCPYCQDQSLEVMPARDLGAFKIALVKKQKAEALRLAWLMAQYPDLRVFADCQQISQAEEIIIARP